MIVGGYSMDLYCDKAGCNNGHRGSNMGEVQYVGETRSECVREARRDGWRFSRSKSPKEAYCPECSKSFRPLAGNAS